MALALVLKQSVHATSSHSSRGCSACAQAVPPEMSVSAMHPAMLKFSEAESATTAPALVLGKMHV